MSVGCLRGISLLFQLSSCTREAFKSFLLCRKNTILLGLNFTCSGPQAKVILGVKFLILITERDGNVSGLFFVI